MNRQDAALSAWPALLALTALVALFLAERVLTPGWPTIALLAGGVLALLAALGSSLAQWHRASSPIRALLQQRLFALLLLAGGGALYAAARWAYQLRESSLHPPLLVAALSLLCCGAITLAAFETATWSQRRTGCIDARRTGSSTRCGLALAMGLVALALMNFGLNRLDIRADLSYAAPTAPSAATRALLDRSAQPIEVVLFFEKQSLVLAQVRDYFEALADAGATLRIVDQQLDFDLAKQLKVNRNGTITVIGGERHQSWVLGEDFENARRRIRSMDDAIRGLLSQLTRAQRTVYLSHEHGERPDRPAQLGEADAAAQFGQIVRSLNNKVLYLSPARLGREVPRDADVVVIHGPTQRFLPQEVASLRAYIRRGGALLLLLDPEHETGLDPVLEELGLSRLDGVLAHEREFFRDTQTPADRGFIFSTSFANHPAVATLNDVRRRAALMFRRAGALERHADSAAKTTFVARSRARTFLDLDGDWQQDEEERVGIFNLAATVELNSEDGRGTRALVVADADLLDDKLLTSEPNLQFALDALLWLLRDDQDRAMDIAPPEHVPIRHTRDRDLLWFYGSTVLAPLLVLLAGLGVAQAQRRRPRRPLS